MGFTVWRAEDHVFVSPSWRPDEPDRALIELRQGAGLRHSQANLWRYPPGSHGRRHSEPLQEEVFCVVEGTLTMFLGEPPERFELAPSSVVVVEPGTPLQVCNESEKEVVVFVYGAPQQASDYKADVLGDAR